MLKKIRDLKPGDIFIAHNHKYIACYDNDVSYMLHPGTLIYDYIHPKLDLPNKRIVKEIEKEICAFSFEKKAVVVYAVEKEFDIEVEVIGNIDNDY